MPPQEMRRAKPKKTEYNKTMKRKKRIPIVPGLGSSVANTPQTSLQLSTRWHRPR